MGSLPTYASESAAGCYTVSVTANGKVAKATSLRLTEEMAPRRIPIEDCDYKVAPARKAEKFTFHAACWRQTQNKVTVVFTNTGLSGVKMKLRQSRLGYEGLIENFWDFEPWTSDAREVRLVRFACEGT